MGNCQACMNDITSTQEENIHIHQKTASLQQNNIIFKSSSNHFILKSENSLQQSRNPSFLYKENYSNEIQSVNLIFIDIQSQDKQHVPSQSFAVQANISNEDFQQLISSPALRVYSNLGPYHYLTNDIDDQSAVYLGPYELINGAIYDGEWKLGMRHGKGQQIWKDGSIYEGYWKNNQAQGCGRLIHSDGDYYDGHWENDVTCGFGIYVHYDGAKYEGEWKDDKQHGTGIEQWQDGTMYQGTYVFGKKEGQGIFKWPEGSYYEGEFKDNAIDGQGEQQICLE